MAREPMTIRAYAKHRGVNESSVRKAIATQRIPVRADGKIDAAAADRAWNRNTDIGKPRNSVTGNPTHRQSEPGVKVPMGLEKDGNAAKPADPEVEQLRRSLAATHAARAALGLRRERIELDQLEGKLVDADAVRALAFTQGRKARDMVLSIPDRIDRSIEHQPLDVVRKILAREVRLVSEEIAKALAVPEKGKGGRP